MTDKEWIDKKMSQPERRIEDLSESEIKHYAYRWLKIDNACSAMGGFANFRHWINRHAVNYFNSLKPLKAENAKLKAELEIATRAIFKMKTKRSKPTLVDHTARLYFQGKKERDQSILKEQL